jgi:HlyD family secretion protein
MAPEALARMNETLEDVHGGGAVGTSSDDVRRALLLRGARSTTARRAVLRILLGLAMLGVVVASARIVRSRSARGSAPAYTIVRATRSDVRVTVTATGTLEAMTTVEVGAEVTGRLLSVLVDANDLVKKGQLLAVIDPEQLRAAVDESTAQVASAEANIRLARATLVETTKAADRARQQTREGLVSQKDLEAATAAAERAEATLATSIASAALARATLSQARSRLDKTKIVSPIDGIVLARHVEPGQTVTAGFSTPLLFKLAQDLTHLRLNVDVDEADIARVREEQEATFTVDAYPDRTFPSKVSSLRNEPKTSAGVVTYQGVLSVENEQRLLRPGMTCTATILSDVRKGVLVVPNAALRFAPPVSNAPGTTKEVGLENKDMQRKQRVFRLVENKPSPVFVRAGATDGAVTEIAHGDVAVGTEVIVDIQGPT